MRKPILAVGLACLILTACHRTEPGASSDAENACVPPGNALMARALLDQANGTLAHADARSAITSLEAGLQKIGDPNLAAPATVVDNAGAKIQAVRGQGDPGQLAAIEQRVLSGRLADYERYCGH